MTRRRVDASASASAVQPATIELSEACAIVGITERNARRLMPHSFPKPVRLGHKRLLGREQFQSWFESKFGARANAAG